MKPEKQQLIDDLIDGESRREATLLAGAKILRHRRYWRAVYRISVLVTLAVAAVLMVEQGNRQPMLSQISTPQMKPSAPIQVRSLTDDELLALFPNTPVGLATLPNGKKLLIFPRPGDAAKFISRL